MTDSGAGSSRQEFIERVEAALPIHDIVGWLVKEFPDATQKDVMGMLQQVYQSDYEIEPAASEVRRYHVGENTWNAVPQRVSAGRAGSG